MQRGLCLDESIQVARWLESDGTVDALEMTAGSSLLNPMYLFKGPAPLREFAAAMRQSVRLGVRLFGPARLHSYPYEDGYREPDLVRRLKADASTQSKCSHCNRCMPTIYTGTRSVEIA